MTTPPLQPRPPAERWARVKEIAGDLLDLPAPAREPAAAAACRDQPDLLADVLGLIRSFDPASAVFAEKGPPASAVREALDLALTPEGSLVGRYRIARPLGSGGMGTVFEARDETLGRPVALKLIHGATASASARRRFHDESHLLALLRHPGVAQVYDTGIDAAGPAPLAYLAMELIPDARTLTRFVRETGPADKPLAALLARIADAVHHGHQRGVIHRDLKPANILVDPDGNPKVIDFGIARLLGDGRGSPAAGTRRYMPPEQASGPDAGAPDVRGDVYALGVVLAELLEGRHAPGLAAIAARAGAPDPDHRYASALELASDLRRFVEDHPLAAQPPSLRRAARLWVRRHRVQTAAGLAVLAALLLGLIGLSVGLLDSRRSQAAARREADRSAQIAGFLRNTIVSADTRPGASDAERGGWPAAGSAGSLPTVPDLLVHALRHAGTAFPDDPGLRAEMSMLLANVLGSTADARGESSYLAAWEAARAAWGDRDARTLKLRRSLVGARSMVDPARNADDARAVFEDTRSVLGPADPETIAAIGQYASSLDSLGRWPEAAALVADLQKEAEKLPGDQALARLRLELALPVHAPADPARTAHVRGLVDQARALAGPESAEVSRALFLLADQLSQLPGNEAEHARTVRERARVAAVCHGPSTPEAVDALSELFAVAIKSGDLTTAEEVARRQVRICTESLGAGSLYTPKAQGRLARILTERRTDLELAESLAREATRRSDDLWTANDAWSIFHHAIWAEAVRLQGDPGHAESMLRQRRAGFPPEWPSRIGGWELIYEATVLAECLLDQGRPAEAAVELDHARAARGRYGIPTPSFDRLIDQAQARLAASPPPR